MSTITVTLLQSPRPPWRPRRRHQPWRWVAKAANGRIVATSGESYTNRADALSASETVFGWATRVMLDDGRRPPQCLRYGASVFGDKE